jgi:hypothetical protein
MGTDSHDSPGPPRKVRRILFWGLLRGERPRDFVLTDITTDRRQALAVVLMSGRAMEAYPGWANCRMCGSELGTQDLGALGFVWPEKAEHYILAHGVWTPDCDRLEFAARRR